jgi:hypothetical protein
MMNFSKFELDASYFYLSLIYTDEIRSLTVKYGMIYTLSCILSFKLKYKITE